MLPYPGNFSRHLGFEDIAHLLLLCNSTNSVEFERVVTKKKQKLPHFEGEISENFSEVGRCQSATSPWYPFYFSSVLGSLVCWCFGDKETVVTRPCIGGFAMVRGWCSVMERRARDRMAKGSIPDRGDGNFFFLQSQLLRRLQFRYPFHASVAEVVGTGPWSFYKKCRWQPDHKYKALFYTGVQAAPQHICKE